MMSSFGSTIPALAEYSSSLSSSSLSLSLSLLALASASVGLLDRSLALDSSNLKSARRRTSFAMSFGRGWFFFCVAGGGKSGGGG